jgi:hypothetical protein
MIRKTIHAVQVTVRPDGFTPQTFRWDGTQVRVMGLERVETVGAERRYRVRTRLGCFELSLYTNLGRWFIRRSPTRLGRALWRWQSSPRYTLPAWRRRIRILPKAAAQESAGGSHADGLALV